MASVYYEQDGITIYHGDCRDVLPTLPPVDLVLTDPPYGINADRMTLGNGRRRVYRGDADWDSTPADLTPILALNIPTVVWGGNYFPLPPSRCWFVWDKGTGANDYADCELAWTNRDGVVKRFMYGWVGANAKERHEPDRYHPTQKPIALFRWCLGFFPLARTILDPYMGVGASLIAAKQAGIRAIGIDGCEEYCERAARRLQQSVMPLDIPTVTVTQGVLA